MLSNSTQRFHCYLSVSNNREGPHDLEQDKTLSCCITLTEILICASDSNSLCSTEYQTRQAEACYHGVTGITHTFLNVSFICCEIMISLATSTTALLQDVRQMLQAGQLNNCKKNVFSFHRLLMSQPSRTINGFIFCLLPHGFRCNTRLEQSRWIHGTMAVISVNICVSRCLECLESKRTRPWTFQDYTGFTESYRYSPNVIGPQRYFQFSEDLGWLLNSPSEFLRKERRKGELIFHYTTRTVNHHMVAQGCFGWRKVFLTESQKNRPHLNVKEGKICKKKNELGIGSSE